jgi:hypothetical protein
LVYTPSRGRPVDGSSVALPFRSPHFVHRSCFDAVSIGVSSFRFNWRGQLRPLPLD